TPHYSFLPNQTTFPPSLVISGNSRGSMAGEILFQSVKEFVVYLAQSPPGSYLFWSTIGAMLVIVHLSIWKAFHEERIPTAPPSPRPLRPPTMERVNDGYEQTPIVATPSSE
ncbi:hypothetical protein PMAYCL1PPCAC_29075, partial [Pristionchus mayeri]